jgi:hypothetical protein
MAFFHTITQKEKARCSLLSRKNVQQHEHTSSGSLIKVSAAPFWYKCVQEDSSTHTIRISWSRALGSQSRIFQPPAKVMSEIALVLPAYECQIKGLQRVEESKWLTNLTVPFSLRAEWSNVHWPKWQGAVKSLAPLAASAKIEERSTAYIRNMIERRLTGRECVVRRWRMGCTLYSDD